MLKFTIAEIDDINKINMMSHNIYSLASVYIVGKDDNKLLSYCVLEIKEDYAILNDAVSVEKDDEYLLIVTCKAAFNILDLSGIKNVFCTKNELDKLLEKLKFSKKTNEQYYLNLEGYFLPCNCKKHGN